MKKVFTSIKYQFLLLALLMVLPLSVRADDAVTSRWAGVDITTVDENTSLYLYNVKQNKFVIFGSTWGTKAILRYADYGLTLTKVVNNNKTFLQTEVDNTGSYNTGKYLSLIFKGHGTNSDDSKDWGYYVDRGADYGYTFTLVTGTVEGSPSTTAYIYHLSQSIDGTTYYMQANNDGTEIDYVTTEPTGTEGDWVFVTKDQIEAALESTSAGADAGLNANVTYLIADQDFTRASKKISSWTGADLSTSETDKRYDWRSSNTSNDLWNKLITTIEYGTGDKDNGQYSNCTIEGQGTFSQTITAPVGGWYVIQCNGFYAGNAAKLYVDVSVNGVSQRNPTVDLQDASTAFPVLTSNGKQKRNPDLGLTAGKAFYRGEYLNSLYFYAEEGSSITFGINKPNATKSTLDQTSNSTDYYHDIDYVAVDNFQLKYFGAEPVVLDETQSDLEYLKNENSVSDKNRNATVLLKRSMTKDAWNSLILPINLTSAQVKSAFGENVQLAVLAGTNDAGNVMKFSSVDLLKDQTAVTAGTVYLIKPTLDPSGSDMTIGDKTYKAPFYVLGRHDFSSFKTPAPTVTETTKDKKITATGTYVAGKCPQYAYVLSGGNMYHITKTGGNAIKGFRCYFTYNNTESKPEASKLSFSIDGIDGDTTPVDELIVPDSAPHKGDVYNLNGQLVRQDATSLDGLTRGIYIVNGKKYVVR